MGNTVSPYLCKATKVGKRWSWSRFRRRARKASLWQCPNIKQASLQHSFTSHCLALARLKSIKVDIHQWLHLRRRKIWCEGGQGRFSEHFVWCAFSLKGRWLLSIPSKGPSMAGVKELWKSSWCGSSWLPEVAGGMKGWGFPFYWQSFSQHSMETTHSHIFYQQKKSQIYQDTLSLKTKHAPCFHFSSLKILTSYTSCPNNLRAGGIRHFLDTFKSSQLTLSFLMTMGSADKQL